MPEILQASPRPKIAHRVVLIICLLLITIGGLVLGGWVFNNASLKSILPDVTPMNPMTAVNFILSACIFLLIARQAKQPSRLKSFAIDSFAVYLVIFSSLMLLKYVANIDLHVDRVLFNDKLGINRMAPITAFNFLLSGFSFILLKRKKTILSQILSGIVLLLGMYSLLAYVYKFVGIYARNYINPVAIHTAVGFILLAIGTFSVRPEVGLSRLLRSFFTHEANIGKRIDVIFISGLLIVGFVGWFSYQSIYQYESFVKELQIQLDENKSRKELFYLVLNAETSQRGYVITGQQHFLKEHYQPDLQSYPAALTKLESYADQTEDFQDLQQLKNLIAQKFDEMSRVIDLYRKKGPAAAAALVDTGEGVDLMNQIRTVVERGEKRDQGNLATNSAQSQKLADRALTTVLLGSIFSFIITLLAVIFINRELKKRREIQQKLQENNAKDEAILSGIGDGVFAIDSQKKIILFNPVAAEISGFAPAEAIGKIYSDILKFTLENENAPQDDFMKKALEGQKSEMHNHTVIVTKNGLKIPVADSAAPIFDDEGKVTGVVVVFRDVTREREIDRMKSEFISIVSHQLRTPLGSMRWMLEVLQMEAQKLSDRAQDQLKEAYRSNLRLIRLVGELLNVARIEQNRVIYEPELSDIVEITQSALKEIEPETKKRSITIEWSVTSTPPKVVIDPKRFREVIQNLLTNAVKYTMPGGKVSVSITTKNRVPMMIIKDNGIGIPHKDQGKMFIKFSRSENAAKVDPEGSGLGLYIVKSFVEGWGGKIWFESQEGKGTTFYLTLPTPPSSRTKKK